MKEVLFKDIFSAGGHFIQWIGPYAEHFCEIILDLDQWLKRYGSRYLYL